MIDTRYIWRILLISALMILAMAGLSARLAFLHLGPNTRIKERIDQNHRFEKEILIGRGRIRDRWGNTLAMDLPVKDVFADPKRILDERKLDFVSHHLARVLHLDRNELRDKLNHPGRRFVYIKRFVRHDTTDHLKQLQLPGVHFRDASCRTYPQKHLMSHVVGFSNWEGVGSAGIEQIMNNYLKGRSGLLISEKDGRRKEVIGGRSLDIPPQAGADVYLTLDQTLQFVVEEALDRAEEKHQAKGIWAIVQRIHTGEILAMASRPGFDLNEFRYSDPQERLNRVTGYVYEPGSTFKVAVVAAALNEKLVSPETVVDCENGCWIYRRRPLRDYHPYGNLPVRDVLKKSSNIGAAKIALKLGNKRLEEYLRSFGFGAQTGIELPGEESGLFSPRRRWTSISPTRIAMGHEIAVTALQMLNAVCAIGNGGYLMKPTVLKKVVDAKGQTIMESEPVILGRPITRETSAVMRQLMAGVTGEGGTGRRACIDGYTVAGKTGTAQKAIPGGYSDDENMASFVGFLPAEAPEVGIIVVVDAPQPLHTGGQVAAPVFKEIAEEAVRYLDIPPVSEAGRRNHFRYAGARN